MTLAVDKNSGEVIGQVVSWNAHVGWVRVLTANGYRELSAHDVRLETTQ